MARPKRTGRRANVEVHVSEEQEFIAQQWARPRRGVQSDLEGETDGLSEGGIVTHVPPNTVVMYKPTPQGYMPRTVPVASIQVNLLNGWKRFCPDCRGHHGTDANACPGREPVAIRVCPVCSKRIPDPGTVALGAVEDDPNVIPYVDASSPERRSLIAWLIHMWLRHPRESLERGLEPLDPAYLAGMKPVPVEAGTFGTPGVVG